MGSAQSEGIQYIEAASKDHPANETPIYKCPHFDKLVDTCDGCTTLQQLIIAQKDLYKNNPCFANKGADGNYAYITYGEVYERARNLGSGILNMQLAPALRQYENYELRCIGVFSKNRMEWMILDLANALYKAVMVPIQDQSTEDQIHHIFQNSQIITCFCSAKNVQTILKMKDTVSLQNIVCFDPIQNADKKEASDRKLTLIEWDQVIKEGQNHQQLPDIVPDDLASFCYTSGTTGNAKAAILTHRNLIAAAAECKRVTEYASNDTYFSFLPLTHVLERSVVWTVYSSGAKISFYSGVMQNLVEDIPKVKPTAIVGVPRIYNRIYTGIRAKFDKLPPFQRFLVDLALRTKLKNLSRYGKRTHEFWDRLIFEKIRQQFGGQLKLVISGAAPLAGQIIDFLTVCLSCKVLQGYGSTETNGAIFIDYLCDKNTGNVGGPLGAICYKLVDIPEMDYYTNKFYEKGKLIQKGEICVKGPQLFTGYYKEKEKTQQAFDADGFFHTGDVGLILPNGNLKIIDRKSNIIKLSIGEYISPEKIEGVFIREPVVSEAYIYGNSFYNYCISIVVPNKGPIVQIGCDLKLQKEYEELLTDPQVISAVTQRIHKFGLAEGLQKFELPQQIYLEARPFESLGILANLKIKRQVAVQVFKPVIDTLYAKEKKD